MASLPWFAENAFKPLNDHLKELVFNYPQLILDHFSIVKGTPFAVPLDPSIQMLFYRKDIFQDSMVKRMFYEKHKQELKPPVIFEEYNRIAQFFSEDFSTANMELQGTCVTTGNTEIIASEFLLRYYAESGSLFQSNNKIGLDKDKALKAFKTYFDSLNQALNLSANWWDALLNLSKEMWL
ncbi:type 2 periplasmic-binding domain-containing protein [Gracilibacillus alcaliphilus]|uniref:hypothetical protein n=1 Tax=Gracilibacillus alcaliphilus TaxID=1401441 RepID=UPI00195A12FA|nr:hypothetical protein [Gracilibacillus alcaliphilus]MBM7679120.1 ABC-type glycerol-3-phosphate transport system substrate-binding protein [Gracilibacillus alcaliphilus]